MITKFKLFETHDDILVKCIDVGRLKNIHIGDIFQVNWHHDCGWYLLNQERRHLSVEPDPYRDGKDSKIWIHSWGAVFSTVDNSMDEYRKRLKAEQFDL